MPPAVVAPATCSHSSREINVNARYLGGQTHAALDFFLRAPCHPEKNAGSETVRPQESVPFSTQTNNQPYFEPRRREITIFHSQRRHVRTLTCDRPHGVRARTNSFSGDQSNEEVSRMPAGRMSSSSPSPLLCSLRRRSDRVRLQI